MSPDEIAAGNAWAEKLFPQTAAARLREVPPSGENGLPQVELPGSGNRDLSVFARELGEELVAAPLFRRASELVTVNPETGEMIVMTAVRFMSWISRYVWIYEVREKGKLPVYFRKTMPKTIAAGVLESDEFGPQLRRLGRVHSVRMPVLRSGGALELLPEGYDEATKIFTLSSRVVIDETWTLDQGKSYLNDLYREFGFTDSRSLAVALTLPLAMFGLALQAVAAGRMGFVIRANTQGGGKSLIAQMGITPSHGKPANTAKAKDEELRKILDSAALQASPYLFFDNLKGHFENPLVEAFMTSPAWQTRVMNTQRFQSGEVCTVLIITGNNLTLSPDMQRRCLQCDLFVEEFDPQERRFTRDLNPIVLDRTEERARFLSALWALIRHWDNQGRPSAGTPEKPFRIPSFAEWSDIFGGIVQAAGYGNPLEQPTGEELASNETVHKLKLVELLAGGLSPSEPVAEYAPQDVLERCVESNLFTWLIDGKEVEKKGKERFEQTKQSAARTGLLWTKQMAGQVFPLMGGRRVRFFKKGEGRSKLYVVELVPDKSRTPAGV